MTHGPAQRLWHLLPPNARHGLYRFAVQMGKERYSAAPTWPDPNTPHPWPVRIWGFVYRRIVSFFRRVTLRNYREQAKVYFPELRGLELFATTLVLFGLGFHSFLLARAWGNAHHLRKRLSRRSVAGSPLRVMHVTSSFDIGGTQRQIKNLCIGGAARLEHTTTEIFPELNFMYRQGVTLERDRYVVGGPLKRDRKSVV